MDHIIIVCTILIVLYVFLLLQLSPFRSSLVSYRKWSTTG